MIRLLELTLDTPAWDLALDEALLEEAEQSSRPIEVLRLWESSQPAVVLGRSSRVDVETDRQECARRGIPILRRCSGGAAVVIGPGCLMYSLVLSCRRRPELQLISEAHRLVMSTLIAALRPLVPGVEFRGTSDLTWRNRKFSGNSLRAKRTHLLYHGTLLYDFPLDSLAACLLAPPRQPDYRQGRAHGDFVVNLPVCKESLCQSLARAWEAVPQDLDWPRQTATELYNQRYSLASWNESC